MSTAIVKPEETAVVPSESFLAMIERAARDPQVDVTKLTALVELKERIDAKQAEIEFNQDYAAASLEMPHILKNGVIDMGAKGKIPFARYEDLDRAIRPIEAKYGFSRLFLTAPSERDGILMTVKLLHRSGHSQTSSRFMPPDPGPGRNNMQAIGSASSYAKRYLTLDVWNVVTDGQDDDANSTESLTADQVMHVYDMLNALELNTAGIKAFLKFAKSESVEQIQRHRYEEIMVRLKEKLAEKKAGA